MGDAASILPLLRAFESGNSSLTDESWRRLFIYPWKVATEVRGLALYDGAEAVGYEACIFADRQINGQYHLIGNHSSWVVKPEFRFSSLLIRSGWDEYFEQWPNVTAVAHTARLPLHPLFKASGFQILEHFQWVFLPVCMPNGWKTSSDPEVLRRYLSAAEWQIYQDHKDLECGHYVAWKNTHYCYIVTIKRMGPRNLSTACVLYLSCPEVFKQCRGALHWACFMRDKTVLMSVDGRWLKSTRVAFARRVPLRSPRLYRSTCLQPFEVDNLYSEFLLLNL